MRPDSLWARAVRGVIHLLAWLEPRPGPSEAWCVSCTRNGGRTVVMPAEGVWRHLGQHAPEDVVRLYNGSPGPLAM